MSYLFVGGMKRTGASVIQSLLCDTPDTNPIIADAKIAEKIVRSYDSSKRNFKKQKMDHYFDDVDALRLFNASHMQLLLNQTKSRFPSTTHLVLKELNLTKRFDALHELVPTSKFIVGIRDPRSIIAELIRVGETLKEQGKEHFAQKRKIGAMCKQIVNHYGPVITSNEQSFRNRIAIIRYEDFFLNYDTQLEQLEKFCELKIDRSQTFKELITDENYQSALIPYTETLTKNEIEKIDSHLGSLIKACSYTM